MKDLPFDIIAEIGKPLRHHLFKVIEAATTFIVPVDFMVIKWRIENYGFALIDPVTSMLTEPFLLLILIEICPV